MFKIPKGHDKAILILQRTGIHGIHTVFKHYLEKYLKNNFDEVLIELNTLVSKELARNFIERGSIKEISLKKYKMPSDIADKLGLNIQNEDLHLMELRLVSKPKKYFSINDKVKKFISDPNAKLFEIQELKRLGFIGEYKTSIRAKLNGTYRTIDLSDTGEIRPYYDIDREVEKNKNGHPFFNSIDNIAKDLINDLYAEFFS